MPTELRMPALSPTMEKGTLARWLVAVGDRIKVGDQIAEIETDKATMELESSDEGRILHLLVPAGSENVAVGTVVALIGEQSGEVALSAPTEPASIALTGQELEAPIIPSAAVPRFDKSSFDPAPHAPSLSNRATPLARRVAAIKGIDFASVLGSGSNGRIVAADLGAQLIAPETAIAASGATAAEAPTAQAPAILPPPAGVPVVTEKLSTMRKTIARRLTESKQQVPHFYLTARCNLDPLLILRSELNEGLAARGIKLSVNDMLIKALALALEAVPDANVQFGGEVLHRFGRVDVSMAVAIEGGLITPVLRDVAALSLTTIAAQNKALAEKARAGKLVPEDYQGGTVSVSNLGMFGIDEMFPVINPPQALILGTAAGVVQPWNVNGKMQLATIMAATASFDHRAIDGAVAARFMTALRDLVETPLRLLA